MRNGDLMRRFTNIQERYQWTLPISQVGTYAAESAVRYAFIISDGHFVAMRYSIEPVGQGAAAGRARRDLVAKVHQRVASDSTDISSIMGAMSIDSFGAQSYSDNNPTNWEFLPPEYAIVNWRAKGRGNWTIKLALYCLCCLAAGGDIHIGKGYPPLDSCRQEAPRLFVHNTCPNTAKAAIPCEPTSLLQVSIPSWAEADPCPPLDVILLSHLLALNPTLPLFAGVVGPVHGHTQR